MRNPNGAFKLETIRTDGDPLDFTIYLAMAPMMASSSLGADQAVS